MKNYLEFEKDIKDLEEELEKLKDPFNKEGLSEVDTDKIRDLQIIKDGGWHFSYLQTPENLLKKISSFSHGEHNKPEFANFKNIEDKIKMQKNIFDLGFSYKKIEIDNSFPKYIVENKEKLKKWII